MEIFDNAKDVNTQKNEHSNEKKILSVAEERALKRTGIKQKIKPNIYTRFEVEVPYFGK